MTAEVVEIITRLIFAIVCLGLLFLLGHIKEALITKIKNGQASEVDLLIADFVAAAEQELKKNDPTGEKRKQYVIDCLLSLGILITKEIDARIEAAVFRQNLEIKAVE